MTSDNIYLQQTPRIARIVLICKYNNDKQQIDRSRTENQ